MRGYWSDADAGDEAAMRLYEGSRAMSSHYEATGEGTLAMGAGRGSVRSSHPGEKRTT